MTRQSAGAILLNHKSSGPNERTNVHTILHCARTRIATKLWGSLRRARPNNIAEKQYLAIVHFSTVLLYTFHIHPGLTFCVQCIPVNQSIQVFDKFNFILFRYYTRCFIITISIRIKYSSQFFNSTNTTPYYCPKSSNNPFLHL